MNIIENNLNKNEQIYSVVENGYNTCYIDSVLICLFYKNDINNILENTPKKPEGFYLQELIKNKFINPIQRNYCITSSVINEIRNYSVICGWSSEGNITDKKNCIKYLCFLLDLFNCMPLQFEIFEIKNNIITNNTQLLSLPYLDLKLEKDDSIKNLIQYWINSKTFSPDENIIQCYKLINIPQFIICYINRFNNGFKNKYKIDIMKKIKFFNINDQTQKYIKWKIYGIICHTTDNDSEIKNDLNINNKFNNKLNNNKLNNNKSNIDNLTYGHYYTVFMSNNKHQWILFDDNLIPSFKYIDLKNDNIKEKIMTDTIMVMYTIEE